MNRSKAGSQSIWELKVAPSSTWAKGKNTGVSHHRGPFCPVFRPPGAPHGSLRHMHLPLRSGAVSPVQCCPAALYRKVRAMKFHSL
jgi:hypothetical protein